MLNFRPHPITLKRNALVASVIFPSSVSSITPFENSFEQQAKKNNSEKPSVEELEKISGRVLIGSLWKIVTRTTLRTYEHFVSE